MAKFAASWFGEETLLGVTKKTFTIILRTSGCSWNRSGEGCNMCGYSAESNFSIPPDSVARQLEGLDIPSYDTVKIYTSGSFLDSEEISKSDQVDILDRFAASNYTTAVVETRPEFVSQESLENLQKSNMERVELAFGLETASDRIRSICINKGFFWKDYTLSASLARKMGFQVRTYLLLKPPFLTEKQAISDLKCSLDAVAPFTDVASINPVNVQKGTLVEEMFFKGFYRPPWYWSLFEVLSSKYPVETVSYPSGGGSSRGIHNCKRCNNTAKKTLDTFNIEKDPSIFEHVTCSCKDEWRVLLKNEPFSFSSNLNYKSQNRDW